MAGKGPHWWVRVERGGKHFAGGVIDKGGGEQRELVVWRDVVLALGHGRVKEGRASMQWCAGVQRTDAKLTKYGGTSPMVAPTWKKNTAGITRNSTSSRTGEAAVVKPEDSNAAASGHVKRRGSSENHISPRESNAMLPQSSATIVVLSTCGRRKVSPVGMPVPKPTVCATPRPAHHVAS